jgi:aromatic-amino-acid transaminase
MLHLIAAHQQRPSDDPIFALAREASERRAKGESIVNATVGALLDDDGKLAVLPTAARAVKEVPSEEWAAYAPIAGSPDFLKAAIDDLLVSAPRFREAACAVATPGGSGALRHAIGNYLDIGQALLTTSFFWGPYQTLADEQDRKVRTFEMFAPDGSFDVSALDRALGALMTEQGRALIFLNDPCHNPTGYSMTEGEWRAVVACLLEHAPRGPVTLLLDVAYSDYAASDPRKYLPTLEPLLGKVTVLFAWSASKSFTHYGLRVGALVACEPDPKERAITEAALSYSCRGTWSNCNRGGLAAITRLLRDPEMSAAVRREREGLKALLTARVEAFNRHAKGAGLRYPRYEGGFFVTVFHDDPMPKAAAMKQAGVFVVPMKKGLRLALCSVAERDVERLVKSMT